MRARGRQEDQASYFSSALTTPIEIATSYANDNQISSLFNSNLALSITTVTRAFPSGHINHEFFKLRQQTYRIIARRDGFGPASPLVFLAVEDGHDSLAASPLQGFLSPSRASVNHSNRIRRINSPGFDSPRASLLSSRPLNDPFLESDSATNSPIEPQLDQSLSFPAPHSTPQVTPMKGAGHQSYRIWTTDLLGAESTHAPPLHRFKAFVRLIQQLSRAPPMVAGCLIDEARVEQARAVLDVGEALARFGVSLFNTAGQNDDNSSRAITQADYASLLTSFLKSCGHYFSDSAIARLPLSVQDEATATRMLLGVRCQTNKLIFDQLISNCGLESRTPSGSTMIINANHQTSSVKSNVQSNIMSKMHAIAQAVNKAPQSKGMLRGLATAALSGFIGILALKAGLFRPSAPPERYRSSISKGKGTLSERLIDDRSMIERAAIHRLSLCEKELAQSLHNTALVIDDWSRIGGIRVGGGVPLGYKDVNIDKCSLNGYLFDLGYETRDSNESKMK